MKSRSQLSMPTNGLVVGVVVGLLTISVLMATNARITRSPVTKGVVTTSATEADAFVSAWDRMRSGTWVVDSSFVRTLTSGQQLKAQLHEAQRPPDHVSFGFGTASVTLKGRTYECDTNSTTNTTGCRDNGAAPDAAAAKATELANISDLVRGSDPTYDVHQNKNGCFDLYQRPARFVSQWGTQATFCFDKATGAPAQSDFTRPGRTDVTTATRVSAKPTTSDFELPKQ